MSPPSLPPLAPDPASKQDAESPSGEAPVPSSGSDVTLGAEPSGGVEAGEARVRCGKYLLGREIARGGMGTIWLAEDPQLRRRVALKRMKAGEADLSGRLLREATVVARLQHPHVVQIFDYGLDGSSPYIVMELLDGEDLATRLERVERLPLASAASIVVQVAKGLGAAHAAGVVHLDLKPANIFLAKSADTGAETVKVLDFGIAAVEAEGPGVTRPAWSGQIVGTPWFMSPEQGRNRPVDHRSDLWSLGVVAYLALVGRLPFTAPSFGDLFVQICAEGAPTPSSCVPDLGPGVDRFFERALSKDPKDRFQSARDLAAAFSDLVDRSGDRRATILFVDDEPDMAMLIEQCFQEQIESGYYKVLFASDGEEALARLRSNPEIDVVLCDIRMPRMDGLKFLSRAASVSPTTKVVMVSAYGDMANIRKAMNEGAFDFLIKPIDLVDLEVTVEKAIRHVEDVRRAVRSAQENGVLRMFAQRATLDRITPMVLGMGGAPGEEVDATVCFVGVYATAAQIGVRPADEIVSTLNAVLERIVSEIAAKDGVIDKLVGDTAMAVFCGEDHAERAVAAMLAIRSTFDARIVVGMESGAVVSGAIGSATHFRLDHTVLGGATVVAQQLRWTAAPGVILAGEGLHARVDGHARFALTPVGPLKVPELSTTIGTFTVRRGRAREDDEGPCSWSTQTVEIVDEEP